MVTELFPRLSHGLAHVLEVGSGRFQGSVQGESAFQAPDCFFRSAQEVQGCADVGVSSCPFGIDLQQGPIQIERLLVTLLPEMRRGDILNCLHIVRVEFEGSSKVFVPRLEPPQPPRRLTQKGMKKSRCRQFRRQGGCGLD